METTILRIEHKEDGVGIFMGRTKGHNMKNSFASLPDIIPTFDYSVHDIGNISRKHWDMKSASSDFHNFISGEHYCAYPSVDIMKKWINCEEIKQLIELGFVVLLLDVTDCYISEYQAIYTKESIISSKDITELFK